MKIDLSCYELEKFDLKKYCLDNNIKLEDITSLDLENNSLTEFIFPKECVNIRQPYLDKNIKRSKQ